MRFLCILIMAFLPLQVIFASKLDFSSCSLVNKRQIEQLKASKVHFYQLNNGIKVYLFENHQLPVFALRLLFDVGAADEQQGQSGYAHLFEHMMFKGSKNVPDGEHFAAIKRIGGQLNASTDYDKTEYWTEAPNVYLDHVLWLEAERFRHLSIDEKTLRNQKRAVLEEKLLRMDNVPYVKTAGEFMISAWQGTEYDHLIIGNEEDISKANVTDVRDFYHQFYRPDNLILTLVGDFDKEQVIKRIAHYFLPFTDQKQISNQKKIKTGQLNEHFFTGKSEIRHDPLAPFPLYAIGWHTVGKHKADFYAVELLADILLKHDASRMKMTLKEQEKLVFETIGFPLTFEQAGITAMGMVPHSYASFEQIKSQVKQILDDIQTNGVSPEELCSAKKHRQLVILNGMASNRQLAQMIGDGVLFFNNPEFFIDSLAAYENIDNEEIKRIAQYYFHEDWLALEVVPGPGIRLLKWLLEVLPETLSKSLEQQFL